VEDFRIVDYEAISMLNVSATQEQQRIIEDLRKELETLRSENKVLRTKSEIQDARLEAIEKYLRLDQSARK